MSQSKEAASKGADDSKYAAIYVRVSTEDQGKGYSIPTQKEACQKLAACEEYAVPESYVLIDEGVSGSTLDRAGLRTLRDLVHTKAVAAVVVHDPDRLSRNLGHQLLLAEEFERAGVKLLIVSHPLEQGPEGWLFFQMRGALAEYERAKTAERTMRGRIGRVKAGHPHGGHAPLGYQYVSEPHAGHWEIAPEEAALVRRIFTMCLNGMSTRAIARQLTRERVPTRLDRHPTSGGRKTLGPGLWAAPMVQRILTNEGYTGRAYWGKRKGISKTRRQARPREEWIAFPVPAILDEATFHAVQQQLQRNCVLSPRNRKYEYLLIAGRFRCGRCGRAMTGLPMKGVRHYRCNGRTTLMDPAQWCRGHIKAAIAEERVWATVERLLQDPDLIVAEVTRQQAGADERRAALAQELSLVETGLAKCDREEQRWAEA
jgi:site-specific DNA recombinase